MTVLTGLLMEGDSIPNSADSYFYQYLNVAHDDAVVPASFDAAVENRPMNMAYSFISGNIIGHNCAVGGSRLYSNTFDLEERASIWVDSFWPQNACPGPDRKYIFCVAIGTNGEFIEAESTVSDYVDRLVAYCAARKAAAHSAYSGNQVKVLIATGLPRDDGLGNETNRAAFNTLVRGLDAGDGIDGIIDLASETTMGDIATCSNPTFYLPDKVHPTRAGHTLVLPIFSDAIAAAMA